MYQLLYTALEACCAALLLLPVFLILNRMRFHRIRTTLLYFIFTVYLTAVYAVVGLPNVTYIRFDANLQLIPFSGLLEDLLGAGLNVLLFLPLGLFLPLLWPPYRQLRKTLLLGFCLSAAIELLQLLTFRATDVNDLLTNTAGTLLGYWLCMAARKGFPRLFYDENPCDLPVLIGCATGMMFFFQPLIWHLIY